MLAKETVAIHMRHAQLSRLRAAPRSPGPFIFGKCERFGVGHQARPISP